MSHALVEVDTWTAAVEVLDDGDALNSAGLLMPAQDLADRTLYLRNRLPGAASSYTVIVPAFYTQNINARFAYDIAAAAVPFPVHTDVTSVGGIFCPLVGLPTSGTIVEVVAKVNGLMSPGAHAGLLGGGNEPTSTFVRYVPSTGARTDVDVATDPYANTNQVLYEAPHDITSAVLAEVISADRVYSVYVEGEGGGNALNDKFGVYAFAITIEP